MTNVRFDPDLLEAVAARLDLREPNRDAVHSVAIEMSQHLDVDHFGAVKAPTFECVVDSATGVGKTFIMAGLMEYLAVDRGIRNFAVIAPGRTILSKTVDNFTPGHGKSLLGSMDIDPLLVTSDNFDTSSTRSAMSDDGQIKVYVFTVQSLLKPRTKTDRRTHEFQESLGGAFYGHLQSLDDLVVFADEHHAYFAQAFSDAVRDLEPLALIGLTATPHKKTPASQIVYRYPLAAAIADRWVKTPVIVGRRDDRVDPETQLADGIVLLQAKAEAAASYAAEYGEPSINPIMLVIAKDIEDAKDYERILAAEAFDNGAWAKHVLRVDSSQADEALALLEAVEDPDSSVRIIVAVGMLKEGWDVKNVYVIVSMRASVSETLTEQTLGRGMRLPWGRYTGIEMLDTLEVLAHERYEDLLKKANVLNEAFIDHRTRAVLRKNAKGELVAVVETTAAKTEVSTDPVVAMGDHGATIGAGSAKLADLGARMAAVKEESGTLTQTYVPRDGMPTINVPRLEMTVIQSTFSLADIMDHDAFRALGRQIASDPEGQLRRTTVSARIIEGMDGVRRTELVTSPAVDKVEAASQLLPLEESRTYLAEVILNSEISPARNPKKEREAVQPILDAFLDGLGEKAEQLLSAYRARAAGRLVRMVADEARRVATPPTYVEVVEVTPVGGQRNSSRVITKDRTGPFARSKAYNGWSRSLYAVDWFDSAPERDLALAIDQSDSVRCWVRLQRNDVPILWRSDGRIYNADFIVVDNDGTHWVVEVKSDKELSSEEVRDKRQAARRWTQHVSADEAVGSKWRYLLVGETDIRDAKGSWLALKSLGT